MNSDTLAVLTEHPLFEAMTPESLATVLDSPDTIDLMEGQVLFRQGDHADRIYVLDSGAVELLAERNDLPDEVLARLGPGEFVGANALMPDSRHAAAARVVQAGRAVVISGPALHRLLDGDFALTLQLIAVMAGSLRGQIREITELKLQSTTERLASYLVTLAGDGDGRAIVRLPFEKRLLADRLGMEPATLSRAFARLREFGVETGRGDRVEIANLHQLRAVGDSLESLIEGGFA
ncbi:cAMP-binding proteins-catabolite gene activator and regulatory subunit of cAMP-dependent protein [Magnetospirillum sp. LM-5]|uniref:cyclic nucleotide-binding domain-containing protein n=1 Tax=Magnetospirillum sp. LM-5 TaxID=2681466 RepID=UPI00137CC842|nr:cyclic nucleotide-binding domain-containing protein [Magnetospirillum sp. LM-5]CAA7611360.1 cAMP-binding proteins-catabolite gene activator and regulatory subunit of cAMP-dependent protein [Magnetospirillum sp. LM-5]